MTGLDNVDPKQLGNLQERMQYLVALAQQHHDQLPTDVWHAIWDLKTEVERHTPANPPYGRRMVPVS
jgi:hypothetical protein